MARVFASQWLWLAIYLATVAGIAVFTIHLRDRTLADDADNAKAQQSWQQWQAAEAQRELEGGPIKRAPPTSPEPPMVVMMRDNFAVILAASVIFPGIILGFLMIVIRGVLRQSHERKRLSTSAPDASAPKTG